MNNKQQYWIELNSVKLFYKRQAELGKMDYHELLEDLDLDE